MFVFKVTSVLIAFCAPVLTNSDSNMTSKVAPPAVLQKAINVPQKLLMGPGPSNVSPRVLQAQALPVLGHMHKEAFQILDEIKAGLQYVFQTTNPWTIALSGPGHLGMEASIVNLVEPGDKVLVGVNGIWGIRAADLIARVGGIPIRLEKTLGESFTPADIEASLKSHTPKVLFLVHSESSTGVMQPLDGIGDLCRQYNTLFVLDTVASLGGVPFSVDDSKIDVVYSGSQKVLGVPPGLAPITFGPRAIAAVKSRKAPVKSFLVDMNLLTNYWNCNDVSEVRGYHHTPPMTLLYALREGLAELASETLQVCQARHAAAAQQLYAGLDALGLQLFVKDPASRLPTVTTVKVPAGIDWKAVNAYLMDKHLIEIAGGLGPTAGLVWRIGIMGYNAKPENVTRVLAALKEAIEHAKSNNL